MKLKSSIILIALALLATSCGPSPIAEQLAKAKQNKIAKAKADSTRVVDTSDNLIVTKTDVTVEDKTRIESREISKPLKLRYPKGVYVTIYNTVRREFPRLSKHNFEQLVESITEVAGEIVDNELTELVEYKTAELSKMGLLVEVDAESPIDISSRFVYVQSSNEADSITYSREWQKYLTKKRKTSSSK